jgi:hypothetical protein
MFSITFVDSGKLGLKIEPLQERLQVVAVNPGTQAERYEQLRPGLVLTTIAGRSIHGESYAESMESLKVAGRPLALGFVEPITVIFVDPGKLGLKTEPLQENFQEHVQVVAINPGTQAEQHEQLRPGLVLTTIAGRSIHGESYAESMETLKAAGRPLALGFVNVGLNGGNDSLEERTRASKTLPPIPGPSGATFCGDCGGDITGHMFCGGCGASARTTTTSTIEQHVARPGAQVDKTMPTREPEPVDDSLNDAELATNNSGTASHGR